MKKTLLAWYLRFLNFLHSPMVKPAGSDPFHSVLPELIRLVAEIDSPVMVELGSRRVTGNDLRKLFPFAANYIGMDIHPGEGVDFVGDVHQLANLFEPNSVDAIVSASVFEHLLFPWKVVLEINRVLKPGGYTFISTHPAWPAHELPWDFWRFPVAGLAHLFNPDTGFEVIRAAEGAPFRLYAVTTDPGTRDLYKYTINAGVAVIARKISDYDPDRLRWNIDLPDVIQSTYPRPVQ